MWGIMINSLTKECDFEIVNLSVTKTHCTKLHTGLIGVQFCL